MRIIPISRPRSHRRRAGKLAYLEFLEARQLLSAVVPVNTAGVSFSEYLGGTANDGVDGPGAMAIDANGNVLLGGWTESIDLPNATNANAGLPDDGYVTKFDSSGNLLWTTYVGGTTDISEVTSLAVDGSGNTFVTGFVDATDLAGALNSAHGGDDAFVVKIGPAGNVLWSLYLGGSGNDDGTSIAVDSSGNAYVTGITASSDFTGATGTYAGSNDAFVAKVDGSGTLQWATYFGGTGDDEAGGISVNAAGEAIVAGTTSSKTLAGATNTYGGGPTDAFVARFDAAGAAQWVTYVGGTGSEEFINGNAGMFGDVAWDTDGTAVVTGFTNSTKLPLAKNKPSGGGDAFVARIDGAGSVLWSDYLGAGAKQDNGEQVVLDAAHNAYVVGVANYTSLNSPTIDSLVAKVDASGNVDWIKTFGGSKNDHAAGAALDAAGNLWFAGETASTDLPQAVNANAGESISSNDPFGDAFIAEIPAHTLSLPSKSVISSVPKTVTAGAMPTVTVTLEYSTGQVVANDTTSVTISLVASNGATLGGTTTVPVINGVATFNDLAIGAAGFYTFSFSDLADGFAGLPSSAFTITPDAASSQLVITQHAGNTPVGLALTPAFIVQVQDRFGNLITTDHSAVQLGIVSGPSGGALTGVTTVHAVKGVATFSKAALTATGDYMLGFSDASAHNNSDVQYAQTVIKATTTIPPPKSVTVTFGQTITISAKLLTNSPAIPFTGMATIYDNFGDPIGSAAVAANGTVKFTVPTVVGGAAALSANSYTATLSYAGDANHTLFTSSNFTILVKQASTATTLATPPASVNAGDSLTLTATVASTAVPSVAPTGAVTFYDNGTAVGTIALSGHTASFNYVPSPGVHKYTAAYAGDVDFAASATTGAPKSVTDFLAPAALAGDSIVLMETAGTTDKAPPGLVELDFAASGKAVTVGDFVHAQSNPGTYTYKRTGPTTGTIVLTTHEFVHGVNKAVVTTETMTFLTVDSATVAQKYSTGETSTSNAALFTAPLTQLAPAGVTGEFGRTLLPGSVFNLTATNGSGAVGGTGVQVLTAANSTADDSYTLVSISGPDVNTNGTYLYTQNSPPAANLTISDGHNGTARIWLFYTSSTAGYYYDLTDINGWQTGTFTYQPPAVG